MGGFTDFVGGVLQNAISPVENLFNNLGQGNILGALPDIASIGATVAGAPDLGSLFSPGTIATTDLGSLADAATAASGVSDVGNLALDTSGLVNAVGGIGDISSGLGGAFAGLSSLADPVAAAAANIASPFSDAAALASPFGAAAAPAAGDVSGGLLPALANPAAAAASAAPGGAGGLLSSFGDIAQRAAIGGTATSLAGAAGLTPSSSPALSLDTSGLANAAGGTGSAATQDTSIAFADPNNPGNFTSFLQSSAVPPGGGGGSSGLLGDIIGFIKRNPSLLLGGAGLGLSALAQPSQPKQIKQAGQVVSQQEAPLASTLSNAATSGPGGGLLGSLTSGQLPPGFETLIQNQTDAAKAQILSSANARGMSASDTPIQQELANVDRQAIALRAQLAQQFSNFGLQELLASGQISAGEVGQLSSLGQVQLSQDQQLSEALAQFASAVGLGAGFEAAKT